MSRLMTGTAGILAALSLAWSVTTAATLAQDATPAGSAPACMDVAIPEVDAVMQDAYGSGTVPGTPVAGTPVSTDELPQGQPADAETADGAHGPAWDRQFEVQNGQIVIRPRALRQGDTDVSCLGGRCYVKSGRGR